MKPHTWNSLVKLARSPTQSSSRRFWAYTQLLERMNWDYAQAYDQLENNKEHWDWRWKEYELREIRGDLAQIDLSRAAELYAEHSGRKE